MPANVPSGYTRGPILFINICRERQSEETLLRFFWEEAGAYGARIVIVTGERDVKERAQSCADLFADWESDSVEILSVENREDAKESSNVERVQTATALLLMGDNPVRLATILGGTPLARALRRANARGKAICGYGHGAALLCEHMIAHAERDGSSASERPPFLRRHLIQFAPGLGITNRVVLDTTPAEEGEGWERLSRLLHAVAYNPFLIGVGLEVDTGAVIYADNTLEIFGRNSALIVDGADVSFSDVHENRRTSPLSLLGMRMHALGPDFTFNLQERVASPPVSSDIPEEAIPENALTN